MSVETFSKTAFEFLTTQELISSIKLGTFYMKSGNYGGTTIKHFWTIFYAAISQGRKIMKN